MALFDKFRRKESAGLKEPSREPNEAPTGEPYGTKPAYPDNKRLYCVGDIHGRADLLDQLHKMIESDACGYHGDKQLLYLGDYIDRGEESSRVVDILLKHPLPGFEAIHLLGNHEQALLDFLLDPHAMASWLGFGGVATLQSYGIETALVSSWRNLDAIRAELEEKLPNSHREFYENCILCHAEGSYYFVHAGIRPGVPLEKQQFEDQLWIREAFTASMANHGAIVVHGHTISAEPELLPNRIGIDTGAFATGVLTALVLEGTDQRLLQTGAKNVL